MHIVKKLAGCIREYKRVSLITPFLIVFEVVLECIIPFIVADLVNAIQDGCDIGTLVSTGLMLTVLALLSLAFGAAAGKTCSTASCGLAKNLRHDMFDSVQSFSFENIDKFSTSSLVTRLTTDVANVQMAYMMIIRTAVRCPLMFVFAFVMAFVMGGKMAIIFVGVVPILGIALAIVIKSTMPLFRKVFKKYDALNSSIQENIKGIRVVKSYVREDFEREKFDRAADDVCRDFTKAERILAFNGPVMQFCLYAVMVFVLTVGSKLIVTTSGASLDVGQLSAILTYGFMILNSLMMVSMIFVMITLSAESCVRIAEVA